MKIPFNVACKVGQFDVVEQFMAFSINFNAQHVKGMTPFDLVRLLDSQNCIS